MKWFYNLKISKKLIGGFVLIAILASAIGFVGINNIRSLTNSMGSLYEKVTIPMSHLAQISEVYQRERSMLRDIFLVDTKDQKQEVIDTIKDLDLEIDQLIIDYENTIVGNNGGDLFNSFKKAMVDYKAYRENIIEYLMSDNQTEALRLLQDEDDSNVAIQVQNILDQIFEFELNDGQKEYENNVKSGSDSINIMLIILFVEVIMAISTGFIIARSISKPIKILLQAADKLAVGDINVDVDIRTKDEIGRLSQSIHDMIENIRNHAMLAKKIADGDLTVEVNIQSEYDVLGKALHDMVVQNNDIISNIEEATEQIAVDAKQLSDFSMALSQGATEQASAVEELTASIEEISSQTQSNAENTNQVNKLAEEAMTNAAKGNTQMMEMLKAMEEINESSNNINKIIKVIDDIAFQTNILALNAAVEAARAGQYGKGFAVVADEVRTLAARSANAAKETTEMIENSIKKVEGGTRMAKETALSLNEIVDEIEKVASLVNDITIATNEQAIGIEQINQGIMQVSEVIQTNSATSEEGAAASEELTSQAELLNNMVSRFKLKSHIEKNKKVEVVNPEIYAMLESMAEKKNKFMLEEKDLKTLESNPRILLSDREFGKY